MRNLGYARTYACERKDPQSPGPAGLRPARAGRDGNIQRGRGRLRPLWPDPVREPAGAAYPRRARGRRAPTGDNLRERLMAFGGRTRTLKQGSLELGEVVFLPGASGDSPTLAERERQAILDTLEVTHGKLAETARRLGISRTTLWRRLRAYGLRPNGNGG